MNTADLTAEPSIGHLQKIAYPTAAPPGGIALRDPGRMHRRLLGPEAESSSYHVMSRTAGGQLLFGDEEKEAFRILLWRLARFAGVEVLTYCVMGNHFHLLVRVPRREKFLRRFEREKGVPGGVGERRLLEHLKLLYSKEYLSRLEREIEDLRRQGREREVQGVLSRFKARFCDLSLFVKELKERFSRWFNKAHGRCGTLWMDRFRSVLVEDGECLRTMAAYIDLNPVRAALVDRPEDYRWCGYAEALGGSKPMRRGLCRVIGWPIGHWETKGRRKRTGAEAYRCLLYEEGIERAAATATHTSGASASRRGIAVEEARAVIAAGGKLTKIQLLSCRVCWFSQGMALGSANFLERVLNDWKPQTAIRSLPVESGENSPAWHCLSRLRQRGVGP